MTVKEYALNRGVSKQSVYDRIRRGTLAVEMIDGVKNIIGSRSQDDLFTAPLPDIDSSCQKKLEKALKKALKSKHRLDIERVKLRSMEKLLYSKDDEIATLKNALSVFSAVIDKQLFITDASNEIIEVQEEKKGKKKDKKKKKR